MDVCILSPLLLLHVAINSLFACLLGDVAPPNQNANQGAPIQIQLFNLNVHIEHPAPVYHPSSSDESLPNIPMLAVWP
ncbi:hypothetical protein C8F01DRAFT_1104045, partial [Mycena amicta]